MLRQLTLWRRRHARDRFVLLRTGTQGVPGEDVRPDVVWVEGFFSEVEDRFVRQLPSPCEGAGDRGSSPAEALHGFGTGD